MDGTFLNPISVTGIFVVTAVIITRQYLSKPVQTRDPPGPRPLPVIKNLLDFPREKPWSVFSEWKKKWGPIVKLSIFNQTIVVLDNAQDAIDLLEKRGSVCSNRGTIPMAELCGWNRTLILLSPHNEGFAIQRKIIHRVIGTPALTMQFHESIESEIGELLRKHLSQPEKLEDNILRTVNSMMLRLAYGYKVEKEDDEMERLTLKVRQSFIQGLRPGGMLVNMVPSLMSLPEWMPGTGFRKLAAEWRGYFTACTEIPFKFLLDQIKQGQNQLSFASRLLEEEGMRDDVFDQYVKETMVSMSAGGVDTVLSSLLGFYKAMLLFPDVQKKAQAEIDSVVGNGRLPCLADRDALPYVTALTQEVLRWHSAAPLGMPHRTAEKLTFKGYDLPKNTMVIANIWSMLHNENDYPDPMKFDPTRHLSQNGGDSRTVAFGFGRRLCPGRHVAEAIIFLASARTLATLDILPKMDSNGNPILPDTDMISDFVSLPTPFESILRPRSDEAVILIRNS